jgi:uncharacterized protein HemY
MSQIYEVKKFSYLKEVASKASHGNMDVKLGELYLQDDEWGMAIKSLRLAIQKGSLKNKGEAYILLGLAYMKIGSYRSAQECMYKAIEV